MRSATVPDRGPDTETGMCRFQIVCGGDGEVYAEGVRWPDGVMVLRWGADPPVVVDRRRVAVSMAHYGAGQGPTRIVWLDEQEAGTS